MNASVSLQCTYCPEVTIEHTALKTLKMNDYKQFNDYIKNEKNKYHGTQIIEYYSVTNDVDISPYVNPMPQWLSASIPKVLYHCQPFVRVALTCFHFIYCLKCQHNIIYQVVILLLFNNTSAFLNSLLHRDIYLLQTNALFKMTILSIVLQTV